MRAPSQQRALGALFLLLAVGFVGVAWAAANAGEWVIVAGALAIGLWLGALALRGLRPR